MTYRIHYRLPNGQDDSIVLSGETIEEIRQKAEAEVKRRGGTHPWSEKL